MAIFVIVVVLLSENKYDDDDDDKMKKGADSTGKVISVFGCSAPEI